jgi:hypothetical protein
MNKILITMGTLITALIGACVALTVSVQGLQREISKLEARVIAQDRAVAAAVQKFEHDLFARQDADAKARQAAALAAGQRRAAEIKADVTSLPTSGVHKTINWNQDKKSGE